MNLARYLNQMCGTNVWHPWNVDAIPNVEVKRITAILRARRDIEELNSGN